MIVNILHSQLSILALSLLNLLHIRLHKKRIKY